MKPTSEQQRGQSKLSEQGADSAILLPFHKFGSGPRKLLCLHGAFGDGSSYAALAERLDPDIYTLVAMDQRGHGAATDVGGPFTCAQVARDARSVVESLGWEEFDVLGHSMGGKVAQRLSVDMPGRVRRLILMTPVPASGVAFDEGGRSLFEQSASNPELRAAIIDFSTGGKHDSSWSKAIADLSMELAPPGPFAGYFADWTATDFSAELGHFDGDVKIIVGRNDPSLTEQLMRDTIMRWFPQAELQIIEDAGHYPLEEKTEELTSSIDAFLSRGAADTMKGAI